MPNTYVKTILAVIGGVAAWAAASLSDGAISGAEWGALGLAIATALGVYAAPK